MPFTPSLLADTPPGASKRKRRTQPSAFLQPELTPNPKARKQPKQVLADPESPIRSNFREPSIDTSPSRAGVEYPLLVDGTADFQAKPTRTRRCVTPIPPYEPPSVVFTSPREVVATPLVKFSKRKSKSKVHAKPTSIKIIPVKKELPDIDLNAPMPPPSPTDDPILLSGPFDPLSSSPTRRDLQTTPRRKTTSTSTEAVRTDDVTIAGRNHLESAYDSEDLGYYDWRTSTRPDTLNSSDSFSMREVHSSDADIVPVDLPVFNLNDLPPSSDVWSDSDDDILDVLDGADDAVDEGEGEYTGKWRTLLVKTKQDPPSSVTRNRMQQWGRPVSPFPEEVKSLQELDEEGEEEEEEQVNKSLNVDQNLDQDHQDEIEEEEVRRISVEPEEEEHVFHAAEIHVDDASSHSELRQISHDMHNYPSESDSQMEVRKSIFDISHNVGLPALSKSTGGRISLGYQVGLSNPDTHEAAVNPGYTLLDGDDDDRSSDDETELSFVKITSADPRAAARAAAILKQHDYDCFTEIAKSKRRQSAPDRISRRSTNIAEALARRGVSEGRITKDRARKRSSIGTGVIGSQVFISGAPVTTLRNLLEEVEAEVSFSSTPRLPASYSYETPIRRRPSFGILDSFSISTLINQDGEKQWTKKDWKLLDACFTDERLLVGTRLSVNGDGLVDVDTVDLNNVVDRYIDIFGGEHSIKKLGPDWERDAILLRAKALRKKQRSGDIAPPTSADSTIHGTPDMDIPDFTPLNLTRPILPPPIVSGALFQGLREEDVDPWKPPKGYADLMEEAIAVGNKSNEDAEQPSTTETLPLPGAVHSKGHPLIKKRHPSRPETPSTLGGRVKGFLFSYLPSLSKTAPHPSRKINDASRQSRLPLPPPDLLDKPRPPITTPTRPPMPKPKHPKELVKLHPAPLPVSKSSLIPRFKPRRLVELNPIPPPEPRTSVPVIKPRSSNGSVKELVKSFEDLRRVSDHERAVPKEPRPAWKP
ncbi:hypothetical protein AX15_007956 [Amanita polypyramis BW_CC]|nr:hypothetical protein AX15_007956 [Amanita polypyramis BW_CC]